MGYNGRLSLKILEKSVKVQNLPYPLLRGQPLNSATVRLRTSDRPRFSKLISNWILHTAVLLCTVIGRVDLGEP